MDYIEYTDEIIEDKKNISTNELKHIYNYYIYNGFYTILSIQLIKLFSSGFLIFLLLFLIKCIDYNGLKKIENTTHISNYIYFNNLIEFSIYEYFLILILILYFILRLSVIITELKKYLKTKSQHRD